MSNNDQKTQIYRICCTSIDDAKSTIKGWNDVALLKACIAYEMETTPRSTMIRMLERRLRRIEKKKRMYKIDYVLIADFLEAYYEEFQDHLNEKDVEPTEAGIIIDALKAEGKACA